MSWSLRRSQEFLTTTSVPSPQLMPHRRPRKNKEIPFSWALLLIAILEISVWSAGLRESPVREYLIRENNNIRTSVSANALETRLLERISVLALLEQQLRSVFQQEREFEHLRSLKSERLVDLCDTWIVHRHSIFLALEASDQDSDSSDEAHFAATYLKSCTKCL